MNSRDIPPTVCPYDMAPIKPGEAVIRCPNPNCGRLYHVSCWQANGNKCAVLGCLGQGIVSQPSQPVVSQLPQRVISNRTSRNWDNSHQRKRVEAAIIVLSLPLNILVPMQGRFASGTTALILTVVGALVGIALSELLRPRWLWFLVLVLGFQSAVFVAYLNGRIDIGLFIFYWNYWLAVCLALVNTGFRLVSLIK